MYDYVALRKKLLGVDELHFYDLYTPVVPDADMKITFEEVGKRSKGYQTLKAVFHRQR